MSGLAIETGNGGLAVMRPSCLANLKEEHQSCLSFGLEWPIPNPMHKSCEVEAASFCEQRLLPRGAS